MRITRTYMTEAGEVLKLEGKKSVVIPSKKNQQTPIVNPHTGKAFLKRSDQYIKWKKLTSAFWEGQHLKLLDNKVRLPIVRARVAITFYFADDKDKDCTNKAETIMDALVEHGILGDDSFKVAGDIPLKGFLCRDRPRTEIYITILDPGDPGYEYDVTNYDRYNAIKKQKAAARYQYRKKVKKDQSATPTP